MSTGMNADEGTKEGMNVSFRTMVPELKSQSGSNEVLPGVAPTHWPPLRLPSPPPTFPLTQQLTLNEVNELRALLFWAGGRGTMAEHPPICTVPTNSPRPQ